MFNYFKQVLTWWIVGTIIYYFILVEHTKNWFLEEKSILLNFMGFSFTIWIAFHALYFKDKKR